MTIGLPSVLSFERKLEVSDAMMFSGNWNWIKDPEQKEKWEKISITKRQNRGTKSSYEHRNKKDELSESNLAEGDDANLPIDHDTLKVSATMRVIGKLGKPFACNEPNFESAIKEKVDDYKKDETGLKELALRYAYNIANGRFLWRNKVCAEKVKIYVETEGGSGTLDFDAYEFSMSNFRLNADNENLTKLADSIYSGLNGDEKSFIFMKVNAYVKLGSGQHVFPSQEMNMGEKKKVLFQLDKCAAIHNVKIGNAIRTIDDWYPDAEFPIAVEPYGSVTQMGQAYRKSKIDLYTLMLNWLNDKEGVKPDDKNYVVANLIRGGVFGGKNE